MPLNDKLIVTLTSKILLYMLQLMYPNIRLHLNYRPDSASFTGEEKWIGD